MATPRDIKLVVVWLTSFFLLVIAAIFCATCPAGRTWDLITLAVGTAASSVFFPLTVGYIYDEFRKRREYGSPFEQFDHLAKSGILWIYNNRETAEAGLGQAFRAHRKGTIRLVGVSLRVFFNDMGPHWGHLRRCLEQSDGQVDVQALICDPTAPEVAYRATVEEAANGFLGIRDDIKHTTESVQRLKLRTMAVECAYYPSAPYCTFVMFPDRCYYAPNILSRETPVLLPMLVLSSDSVAYKALEKYFEYLWQRKMGPGTAKGPQ